MNEWYDYLSMWMKNNRDDERLISLVGAFVLGLENGRVDAVEEHIKEDVQ